MINIPKGTKDVLPADSYKWHYVENIAREVAELFHVREIRTPVFEHTELFLRGVGDTTDIVNKEMYTFLDKGDRSITLKPEGTAGAVRSFIENGLFNEAMPLKTYYFTPVFRYERPQAGRLREHHQFGIEIFGAADASADAELISLADTFFRRLGIRDLTVNLNSIGCKSCRPGYNQALREYYRANYDKLCPTCRERLEKNPLRILDCKEEGCIAVNVGAPRTIDYLCEECSAHFEKLKSILTAYGIPFHVDPRIVRGLDYYSKTVFEFVSDYLGAKSTVCGGGRYDGLVEMLGGKPCPGLGFGLGRLLLTLENMGIEIPRPDGAVLYLAPMGEEERRLAYRLCYELRQAGISCESDLMQRSLKAQFKYADKLGARFVGVIGESERLEGKVKLKDMQSGQEEFVPSDGLREYLQSKVIKSK